MDLWDQPKLDIHLHSFLLAVACNNAEDVVHKVLSYYWCLKRIWKIEAQEKKKNQAKKKMKPNFSHHMIDCIFIFSRGP